MKLLRKNWKAEGIQLLPANLGAAVEALSQDPVILDALGSPYGDYYVATKQEEVEELP